jgi:DHA1 family bicyclomycin/chloramphenicol resistance-like MFS transporter
MIQQMNEEKKTATGKDSKGYLCFLLIFLGMMSAFGPFVTDMYLPGLPSMVEDFHTSETLVQLSLTMGMIGLAIGQIFFGPMSQKWGRRPVLLVSMILFIAAAFLCVLSDNIESFLLCRLFQGLGGAGGIVLSRAIATDCYEGRELAKMMAIIGAINGIAPAVAPIIGGLVTGTMGWQGVFYILGVLGVLLFVMSLVFRETLPVSHRHTGSLLKSFTDYPKVFALRRFVKLAVTYGLASGTMFAYISSAPFIIQSHYGFDEIGFAVIFGINAVFIGVGSGLALKFKSLEKAMTLGSFCVLLLAVLQLCCTLWFNTFVAYEVISLLILLCLGLVFTTSSALAMDCGRTYTGAAAAIVGGIGFLFGGIVSPIVGLGQIPLTTAVVLITCSAAAWIVARTVNLHES